MDIYLKDIVKDYNKKRVLNHISLTLETGKIYCLMGASGSGKTTLLRILLGLETPDEGTITGRNNCRLTAVFQEDRLCETCTPIENVMMVTQKTVRRPAVVSELCKLLPEESITRRTSTLSGGMKRRVSVCRAMLAPSNGIVMDEPFTGMDEGTKKQVITYIREKSAGRLILISTHQKEDIALLNGSLITLNHL